MLRAGAGGPRAAERGEADPLQRTGGWVDVIVVDRGRRLRISRARRAAVARQQLGGPSALVVGRHSRDLCDLRLDGLTEGSGSGHPPAACSAGAGAILVGPSSAACERAGLRLGALEQLSEIARLPEGEARARLLGRVGRPRHDSEQQLGASLLEGREGGVARIAALNEGGSDLAEAGA